VALASPARRAQYSFVDATSCGHATPPDREAHAFDGEFNAAGFVEVRPG
jgi:predicted nucleic acid-binding protein